MVELREPASFTSPPETHDAPEKGLPKTCPNCKGFLRGAWAWEYETYGRGRDMEVTWFVQCKRCGIHVTEEGKTFS